MSEVDIRYLVGIPTSDAPVFLSCPAHNDKGRANLAVYADHTHCFRCGFHETAEAFCRRLGAEESTLAQLPKRDMAGVASLRRVETVPRSQVRIWHHNLVTGARQHRREWFYARGLNDDTISKHQLGHTGNYFSIPVASGIAWAYKLRADPTYTDPEEPRYLNSRGLAGYFRPNRGGRPTVICEGEFDALLLAQYGIDSITVFNGAGAMASLAKDFKSRRPYVATDNDDAGDEAWDKLRAAIPGARRIAWESEIDGKYINDISDLLLTFPTIQRGRRLRELLNGH